MFFFFNDTATTEIYTLSLHDALPILLVIVNHLRAVHWIFFENFLQSLHQKQNRRNLRKYLLNLQSLRSLRQNLPLLAQTQHVQTDHTVVSFEDPTKLDMPH